MLSEAEVQRIINVVAVARQLPKKRTIHVDRVETEAFRALVREGVGDGGDEPELSAEAAFLVGFNFLPPPDKRAAIAGVAEVLESEVAGFYDVKRDRIVVPLVPLASAKDALEQRAVVAHEAQHALQAQHFPGMGKIEGEDAALAQLALREGDAMAAMGAFLGVESGAPVGRTLRRLGDVTREIRLEALQHDRALGPLDRALALTRERLTFPYAEGMLFVGDLYRAGGFPLVDAAFASPPTVTKHILHPETYLAGFEPRPFAQVALPKGQRQVTTGSLGELQTRVLLAECIDRDRASKAAEGWDGDRFTVSVGPDKSLGLLWATSWDDEAEAKEFEAALRDSSRCWEPNRLDAGASPYAIAGQHEVLRSGRLVAFARGLDAAQRAASLTALIATARAAPPARRRSSALIPPREKLPEPRPGRIEGDVYRNEWLGLVGRIPAGMNVELGARAVDLIISRPDVLVRGGVAISTRTSNRDLDERTFSEIGAAFREAAGELGMAVQLVSSGPTKLSLGNAVERVWHLSGTMIQLRMLLVPICAGTGSIVFMQIYGDPHARHVLDGWISSFRWASGRNLEACAYLDPK